MQIFLRCLEKKTNYKYLYRFIVIYFTLIDEIGAVRLECLDIRLSTSAQSFLAARAQVCVSGFAATKT